MRVKGRDGVCDPPEVGELRNKQRQIVPFRQLEHLCGQRLEHGPGTEADDES